MREVGVVIVFVSEGVSGCSGVRKTGSDWRREQPGRPESVSDLSAGEAGGGAAQ